VHGIRFGRIRARSRHATAPHKAWTNPETALREDPDFGIQGEYYGAIRRGESIGVQVIALGGRKFEACVLEGGLPGMGWKPGNSRSQLKGNTEGNAIVLKDDAGKTTATIEDGRLVLSDASGEKVALSPMVRRSPTLGAKPPASAVVLFDGSSTDAWENGRMELGHLLATGCTSKQRFGDYTLHLEFRTPYMPAARGQQRGNSGIYHSGRWETQILDSFGLDGRDNECGGIDSISKPRLNMCLPPLVWQTYDVEFTAAKFDACGKRIAWPRITVRLNGVPVHEELELARDFTTAAPITSAPGRSRGACIPSKPRQPGRVPQHLDPAGQMNPLRHNPQRSMRTPVCAGCQTGCAILAKHHPTFDTALPIIAAIPAESRPD
jgi:hypothetical protein